MFICNMMLTPRSVFAPMRGWVRGWINLTSLENLIHNCKSGSSYSYCSFMGAEPQEVNTYSDFIVFYKDVIIPFHLIEDTVLDNISGILDIFKFCLLTGVIERDGVDDNENDNNLGNADTNNDDADVETNINIRSLLEEDATVLEKNTSSNIKVPGFGVVAKSTVVSLLNTKEGISKDRLKRVKTASSYNRNNITPDEMVEVCTEIGLFDDIAYLYTSDTQEIFHGIGRIIRMRKQGNNRGKIEYTRPIDLSNNDHAIEIIINKYDEIDNALKYTESTHKVFMKDVISGVEMVYDKTLQSYNLHEKDKEFISEYLREQKKVKQGKTAKQKHKLKQNTTTTPDTGRVVLEVEPNVISDPGCRHSTRKRKMVVYESY